VYPYSGIPLVTETVGEMSHTCALSSLNESECTTMGFHSVPVNITLVARNINTQGRSSGDEARQGKCENSEQLHFNDSSALHYTYTLYIFLT